MRIPHLANYPKIFGSCNQYCSDPTFDCKLDLPDWSPQLRLVFKLFFEPKISLTREMRNLDSLKTIQSGPVPAGEQCDDDWQEYPNIGMYGYTESYP